MKKIKVNIENAYNISLLAFINPIAGIWYLSFLLLKKLNLIELVN